MREVGILASLVEASLTERSAQAALVLGVAGIGKSRVVHELSRRVSVGPGQERPVTIWAGRAEAMEMAKRPAMQAVLAESGHSTRVPLRAS